MLIASTAILDPVGIGILPFLWVFAVQQKQADRQFFALQGFIIALCLLFHSSYLSQLVLSLSNAPLYILGYAVLVFAFWWVRRSNVDILLSFLCLASFLYFIFYPESPHASIYLVLGLAVYAANTTRLGALVAGSVSILCVCLVLAISLFSDKVVILQMLVYVALLFLALRIFDEHIINSPYFRFTRRAITIGITGDSGVGKDTLSFSIRNLFGKQRSSIVHGDAYHLWERNSPMWARFTHIDPRANDLSRLSRDVSDLIQGKSIRTRYYDHRIGRFTRPFPVSSNQFLFIVGLHSLFQRELRELLDVGIHVSASEALRAHWKVARDSQSRSQDKDKIIKSMESRRADVKTYIDPQRDHADIAFYVAPINEESIDFNINVPLKLQIEIKSPVYVETLIRSLIGICGLRVDWHMDGIRQMSVLEVEGDINSEDLALTLQRMGHHIFELILDPPEFQSGVVGVMQLVTLLHIQQKLEERIIN
jgi:uridine kinase